MMTSALFNLYTAVDIIIIREVHVNLFLTRTTSLRQQRVCPSRAGIVSKRRKLSRFLHHLVASLFLFSGAKFHPDILRGSPRAGASNKGRTKKLKV